MQIIIDDTSEIETLSIIDPKTGVDYIADFIGNTGALSDGQFCWDQDRNVYICDQDTFNWWSTVVTANQALDYRINDLEQEHGSDAVYQVIQAVGSVDFVDHAANVDQALDAAFGPVDA